MINAFIQMSLMILKFSDIKSQGFEVSFLSRMILATNIQQQNIILKTSNIQQQNEILKASNIQQRNVILKSSNNRM